MIRQDKTFKLLLMIPCLIAALGLLAEASIQFSLNPASPTSDDPVRLTVRVPGGEPDAGYVSTVSHHVAGSHITINLVTTRLPGDVFILPVFDAVGRVELGKMKPGEYTVTAHWYRSDAFGVPPRWMGSGTFGFAVGFGNTVAASITNAIRLAFMTQEGKHYQIYRSEDLDSWAPHGAPIIGNGAEHQYYEATDGGRGFFRIVEIQQAVP